MPEAEVGVMKFLGSNTVEENQVPRGSRKSLGARSDKERICSQSLKKKGVRAAITNVLYGMISGHQPLSAVEES